MSAKIPEADISFNLNEDNTGTVTFTIEPGCFVSFTANEDPNDPYILMEAELSDTTKEGTTFHIRRKAFINEQLAEAILTNTRSGL